MQQAIFTVLVTLIGAGGFWGFLQWLLERLGKRTSNRKKLETISRSITEFSTSIDSFKRDVALEQRAILDKIEKVEKKIELTTDLSRADARRSLNKMCNTYIKLGYIPYDEYVAFKSLGESYIRAGGNTEIKDKFELCINTLDTITPNK